MSVPSILLPFFLQAALIFALLFGMAALRLRAVRGRSVTLKAVATRERVWPAPAQQAGDAYGNQFELPVLFFALAPLAILTRKADFIFVALAWVFLLLRVAHAFVHVTSNHVPTRFRLFAAGAIVLLAMWIWFALHIYGGF
jgi:hypothetical protein